MSALRRLQGAFADAVIAGPGATDVAANDLGIIAAGIAADRRVAIHHHHYLTSLAEALAATFAVVERLIGADCFRAVARRFAAAHPPTRPCLFEYGADFPQHLGADAATRNLAYLPDIARLDWAVNLSFHAVDAPLLRPEELAKMPPDQVGSVGLRLHPTVHLVASDYPIATIWQAHRPGGDAAEVDLNQGGERVLVLRADDDVTMYALDPAAWALLTACAQGRGLSDALEAALSCNPDADPAALLGRWLARPVFVGDQSLSMA